MVLTSRHRIAAAARLITGLIAACALASAAAPAFADEPGVNANRIIFGQVAALSGPAAALGTGMRDGIRAAFAEANRTGGVQGRELVLESRDDGYEPNNTIAATTQILGDNVFALIGSVGTPTTNAILPLIAESGVPLIGPFTGSEGLRNPRNPLVVNVRASYFQETEVMVDHLTTDLGYHRIAIFYQDDSYGRAGLAGVQQALDRRGMKLVSEGAYQRNTTAVSGSLLDIQRGNPEAVIMIGAYAPCAEFIKLAHAKKMNATFLNISFVGADALAKALGPDGDGVVVTQVVPFPTNTSIPLVASYQAALKAYDPAAKPGFVSLEGFMAGRLAVMALRDIHGPVTRKALLDTIAQTGNFDLGGVSLSFSPTSNQGSNQVWLTVIDSGGDIVPVKTLKRQTSDANDVVKTTPGEN
jgi:branched-chain amino acid transport system substrate-binding protein